jgi:biopolymer transport protein ExbD
MGMAIGNAGKSKRPTPQVNVTPLVDVALVVLIIFMVVAPMITKTFRLQLPPEPKSDAPAAPSTDEPLVLTIAKDGAMTINKRPIARAELAATLPRMIAATKHKVLHFDADDAAVYGEVVAALDECRGAGAKSIAIVTKGLDAN